MKELIKKLLKEALEKGYKVLPYDERPELRQHQYSSLSDPSYKLNLDKIKSRIASAAQIASSYRNRNPQDMYFSSPSEGDGFYQVEFRHDGQIKTKHVRPSGDMEQRNGAFQPSDIGTCKSFQNIARYCFVKAGKNGTAIGASPAEDAANKALLIFRTEILDFLGASDYNDEKGSEISIEKMDTKSTLHKLKKDLETNLGRRLADSEWYEVESSYNRLKKTGIEPTFDDMKKDIEDRGYSFPKKQEKNLSIDPDKAASVEKRQAELRAKIADKLAAQKARRNK